MALKILIIICSANTSNVGDAYLNPDILSVTHFVNLIITAITKATEFFRLYNCIPLIRWLTISISSLRYHIHTEVTTLKISYNKIDEIEELSEKFLSNVII